MANEEVKKKIHFVPMEITRGRAVDDSPAPTVTVSSGHLRFSKRLIQELNLNGKFVRFFYDKGKRVIGFQVKDKVQLEQLKGAGRWKMVRQVQSTGQWSVSLKKIIESQFGVNTATKSYSQLPIKKYVEQSEMLGRGEVFYFFELNEEHVVEKRSYKGGNATSNPHFMGMTTDV